MGFFDKLTSTLSGDGADVIGVFDQADLLGFKQRRADKKADRYADEAFRELEGLQAPELSPEEYQYLGDFNPTGVEYSAVNPDLMGASQFDSIQLDPRLKQAQMQALGSLQNVADSGGMTMQEAADMNRIQSQVASADKGRRDAILQNAQARGMGGSGMEMLAQLQSSQAATDRANQAGLEVGAQAQRRALEAMMQGGQLAGSIRGQDYGIAADRARANDMINQYNTGAKNNFKQFNTSNQMNTNMYNNDTRNNAQLRNLNARQGLQNANVDMRNQVPQQNFQNQMDVAQTRYGGRMGRADRADRASDQLAREKSEKLNALFQVGAAASGGKK